MSLLAACGSPNLPATATEPPKPVILPTPTESVTQIPTQTLIPKPNPTLIPIEVYTATPRNKEIVKIPFSNENNWITGRESIFKNRLAITIDDCYDAEVLQEFATIARENNISLTLYPNTYYIPLKYKSIFTEIDQNNDVEWGYHTRKHPNLLNDPMGITDLTADLFLELDEIKLLTGNNNIEFHSQRAPYFGWSKSFNELSLMYQLWQVQATVSPVGLSDQEFESTIKQNGDGGVIILHTRRKDVDWFKKHATMMKNLNGNKKDFVKITDLFK